MTTDMQTEAIVNTTAGAPSLWLAGAAVVALALAVAAGFYLHGERNHATQAAARVAVSNSETRDLEAKVKAAQQTVESARQQLRVRAANLSGSPSLLDGLNVNHQSMAGVIHDQDATSAQIVDALAGAPQTPSYNTLADRFTSSNPTVDALATNETNLQQELTRSSCGDQCVYSDDSGNLANRQHGTGDGATRYFDFPARWDLRYDYRCPAGTKSGYFDVVIRDQNGSLLEGAVSESTLSGQGVVHKSGPPYPATAQLDVNSNCPWNITWSPA